MLPIGQQTFLGSPVAAHKKSDALVAHVGSDRLVDKVFQHLGIAHGRLRIETLKFLHLPVLGPVDSEIPLFRKVASHGHDIELRRGADSRDALGQIVVVPLLDGVERRHVIEHHQVVAVGLGPVELFGFWADSPRVFELLEVVQTLEFVKVPLPVERHQTVTLTQLEEGSAVVCSDDHAFHRPVRLLGHEDRFFFRECFEIALERLHLIVGSLLPTRSDLHLFSAQGERQSHGTLVLFEADVDRLSLRQRLSQLALHFQF